MATKTKPNYNKEVRAAHRYRNLLRSSAIPKRHLLNLGAKMNRPQTRILTKIGERLGKGCLYALVGPKGVGKTQMAAVLLARLSTRMMHDDSIDPIEPKHGPLYITAVELEDLIREHVRSIQTLYAQMRRRPLLIIDDLQHYQPTDWVRTRLCTILDQRYSQMLDTVLIANVRAEAVEKLMGKFICSRISEAGGILVCDWKSFRNGPEESRS